MSELTPDAEAALAAMSESEVTELLARVRSPEEFDDPLQRAARALRKTRGLDRPSKATKEAAADALKAWGSGARH